jgi:hypothetical protein
MRILHGWIENRGWVIDASNGASGSPVIVVPVMGILRTHADNRLSGQHAGRVKSMSPNRKNLQHNVTSKMGAR